MSDNVNEPTTPSLPESDQSAPHDPPTAETETPITNGTDEAAADTVENLANDVEDPITETIDGAIDATSDAAQDVQDSAEEAVDGVTASSEEESVDEALTPSLDEAAAEEDATEQIQDSFNESPTAESETPDEAEAEAAADASESEAEAAADASESEAEAAADASESDEPAADEAPPARSEKPRKRRKRNRRALDSIKVGEELTGKVRSIQPYGAFVDVGAERDGLIHISELRDGFVEKVEDVVKENDEVTVRVKEVDTERGRLGLTMRSEQAVAEEQDQKSRLALRDLNEGDEYTGTVKSIVEFGAFVDIGARTDGLVHISELSEERVNRVEDVVREGAEVTVRILSVDRRRNRISLTMREQQPEAESYTFEDEEDDVPPLSAMELAFARARARDRRDEERQAKKSAAPKQTNELSDIIDRTLAQHSD